MMTGAPLIAAALSLALAGIALLRPPRHLRQIMFAIGMAALTLESLLVQGLLVYSISPGVVDCASPISGPSHNAAP